ncbi:MAG: hypothetical protein GY832_39145 [Chloroflexi bacterium]|nr:hypothetical protein [Chloroflexota bacterium]
MRQSNFKLDWFIPNQIAGLTHFHSDVTQDDFMGVIQKGQELVGNIENEFHILIDNRVVNSPSLVSLDQMKQMVPYMSHPLLRWVVVVKPESLALDTSDLPVEKDGQLRLKNVSSLTEAIDFLREMAPEVQWQQADETFFPNAELDI